MNLRNLQLKKAYSSDQDSILHDFYIPALQQAHSYDRLAGFFSSSSLAIAARGIMGLIRNGGAMRLIVSPRLSREDIGAILSSAKAQEEIVEHRLLKELDRLETDFVRDHVSALGWMLSHGILQIRVAVPTSASMTRLQDQDTEYGTLFHVKVGVLRDSAGNTLSFSGSVNETAAGWLHNVEEFKVFRDWDQSESPYVHADEEKFHRFWTNQSSRVRVIDIPSAVERKLVDIAPVDIGTVGLNRHYFPSRRQRPIDLYPHQTEAINEWLNNHQKGLFVMATGTGKTFAALGCLDRAAEINHQLLVVIACPYQHLMEQWQGVIGRFGFTCDQMLVADGSNRSWKNQLADAMMDLALGTKENVIVFTTHATFSSKTFADIIRDHKAMLKIMLIADEVHGLGASQRRTGLLSEYDLRLGLSATPTRWFDSAGTRSIYDFFEKEVFQFGLAEGINTLNPRTMQTYLVPYRYLPRFAQLTSEEMHLYADKTRRIARLAAKATREQQEDEYLESLRFARADIIKNAHQKYEVLESILDTMGSPIKWTIVYCSPQQIDEVMHIVNDRRITAHRFTMEQGTSPAKQFGGKSERQHLLQEFGNGKYQALVAMRCLDEGVDVPPARNAILMASSGNPREYIQRIGRVIRRSPGKNEATVHDIIVQPSVESIAPELRDLETRIMKSELQRCQEIARSAVNNAEALTLLSEAMESLWE